MFWSTSSTTCLVQQHLSHSINIIVVGQDYEWTKYICKWTAINGYTPICRIYHHVVFGFALTEETYKHSNPKLVVGKCSEFCVYTKMCVSHFGILFMMSSCISLFRRVVWGSWHTRPSCWHQVWHWCANTIDENGKFVVCEAWVSYGSPCCRTLAMDTIR